MSDPATGYAVFLFEQAAEALGEAVKPYLRDGPSGAHIPCHAVDTGGAFVEMTLSAPAGSGEHTEIELMIPLQMVRMIVSMRSDETFGFALRGDAFQAAALPVVGPDAPPARTPSAATPGTSAVEPAAGVDDRRRPPEG